jgi:asparagine synthase (glutamine-hydrolysing)
VRSLFGPGELPPIVTPAAGRAGAAATTADAVSDSDAVPVPGGGGACQPHGDADAVTGYELGEYLLHQLLRDTDQMSMAHSIEVRVPLLDDNVVRVALSLPAHVRTAPGKALLAAAGRVDRPAAKRPFALPFDRWIRGALREPVRDGVLADDLPLGGDVLPRDFRVRVWRGFEEGRVHWSRPWALMVLRRWLVEHRVEV